MKQFIYVIQVYASLVLFLVVLGLIAFNMPTMFISSTTIVDSLNGGVK